MPILKNTINPIAQNVRPTSASNLYASLVLDATAGTAQGDISAAVAGKQQAVYGLIITNTHVSQHARVIFGSGSDPIIGGATGLSVPANSTLTILAPEGLGPLALTADSVKLRGFALGASGGTVHINVIYRTV